MTSDRTAWAAAILLVTLAAIPAAQDRQVVVQGGNVDIRIEGGNIPPELAAMLGRGMQPMAMGTGLIVGQAYEASSGQPIPGALVTLGLPGAAPLRVLADGQGRFAFKSLPPGSFSLSATKPGFADGAHGRRRPEGPTQPVVLDDGDRVTDAQVPLWRLSAITGVVTDERGEPVVDANVQALVRTTVAGMPKLNAGPTDQTDDRGVYRIGRLTPGDYVVVLLSGRPGEQVFVLSNLPGGGGGAVATFVRAEAVAAVREGASGMPVFDEPEELSGPAGAAPDGTPLTYQTLFYPGSATPARAATVRLGSGEERSGVDFARIPVPSARVTGIVTGPDGPAPNQTVSLIPAGSEDVTAPVGVYSARSGADGRFAIAHVAPGAYTLRVVQTPRIGMRGGRETVTTGGGGTFVMRAVIGRGGAQPPLPDEPTLWAELPVNVEGHVDVPVALSTGARVTGQVSFAGSAERPAADQLPSIRVSLDPADGRTAALQLNLRGRIEPTGLFRTMSVPPGSYFVRVDGLPQGWYFRGATLGGRDVSDEPLTVEGDDITGVTLTFTDQQTSLAGSVTNADNQQDTGALVIVFPADRSGWVNYGSRPRRIRSARVMPDGTFEMAGLPPGEYLAAAVRDEIAGDWQRTDFLEAVAVEATRVRLADGDKQNVSLRVVR
jgi:hypothetical protein